MSGPEARPATSEDASSNTREIPLFGAVTLAQKGFDVFLEVHGAPVRLGLRHSYGVSFDLINLEGNRVHAKLMPSATHASPDLVLDGVHYTFGREVPPPTWYERHAFWVVPITLGVLSALVEGFEPITDASMAKRVLGTIFPVSIAMVMSVELGRMAFGRPIVRICASMLLFAAASLVVMSALPHRERAREERPADSRARAR